MTELVAAATRARFPAAAFRAPALAALDARGRMELEAAGRVMRRRAAEIVFREGEPADAFYVVVDGSVRVEARRRGEERAGVSRLAQRGESFGEEAALLGLTRRAGAVAETDALLVEVPIGVYARAAGRAGRAAPLERELRSLRRSAAHALLGQLAPELGEHELELVLDGATHERSERGARLLSAGEPATFALLLLEGMLQLQTERDGRAHVVAYLQPGDLCGDDACLHAEPHTATAVALGPCHAFCIPAELLRKLVARRPELVQRLSRVAEDRESAQRVAAASAHATQHVLRDVYRMDMARALLAIDAETCVRCGHCAWACGDMHGVSRLVRRGERVVARLTAHAQDALPRALVLPGSCQHCRNPMCMVDCPTGAIGRDPGGDVFIREELCTGCGACAKACPWDNVRMAPRADGALVAVKCDLCRDYEHEACVQACPTGSIVRLEPARDFVEVRRLLRPQASRHAERSAESARTRTVQSVMLASAASLCLVGCVLAWKLRAAGVVQAHAGVGLAAGVLAGLGILVLAAHSLPKRLVRVWMRPRRRPDTREASRSRLRPLLYVHLGAGGITVAGTLAHAGARAPATAGGALAIAFWMTTLLGVVGAVAYRALPRMLARLERRASLPEDRATERRVLLERLEARLSGRDALVKAIAQRIILPYATNAWGGLSLVASGRSLHDEERVLCARIDAVLDGRGGGRLDGLDDIVRLAVELRALPARRALELGLRGWLPLHALLAALLVALLAVHVVGAAWW